ncbi:hypothetical protein DH09_02390 [Bacillaceae bacterium JMAK1]|nr:hypothetical protein DH09_02390 [Bacillaceae bacterium JMAK1]
MEEVKKQKVKPMRWGYLGLLILPSVASFAAAASPVWSQAFAWGFASIIALLFIYSVIFVLLKQYEQEPLRLLYGTIVINISTVIILIASWRVFNENIWLGLLLLSLFICHVTFGITHRKRVNDAIRNPKKHPTLHRVYKTIIILLALLGPASYGLSVALGSYFAADTILIVFASLGIPFAFFLSLITLSSLTFVLPTNEDHK